MLFEATDDLSQNILLLIPFLFKRFVKAALPDDMIKVHQFFVLRLLYSRCSLSMTSCSEILSVPKSNMTMLVDGLVQGGYVLRAAHERDRRVIMLHITAEGEKYMNSLYAIYEQRVRKRLEIFEECDRKELSDHVKAIMGIMNKYLQAIDETKI